MAKRRLRPQPPGRGQHIAPQPPVEESPEQRPPVFCLRYMRRPYSVDDCDKDDKAAFASRLYLLSQMTWAQIKMADRHGAGTEKIATNSIRVGTDHLPQDVDLLALRFSGNKPMVGYRDGVVFHIIWLDHSFTVYNHG